MHKSGKRNEKNEIEKTKKNEEKFGLVPFFLGLRLLKKNKIMKFVLYGLELITQRRNFSLIKLVGGMLLFCYLMFLLYWYMSDI